MNELTNLGVKYNTDKAGDHHFTEKYYETFKDLKNDSLNFLEIGIFDGASLKMWKDFFPNSNIFGIDIQDKTIYTEDRIKISIGDQTNINFLQNVFPEKIFDVILDDGGHRMEQQQITLSVMMNRLKSGGIYIIEDLHTSHMPEYGGFYASRNDNSTLKLLLDLATKIYNVKTDYYISKEEISDLNKSIHSIELFFYRRVLGHSSMTAIIKKR